MIIWDISGFLGLFTSRPTLGGSWVLDFHNWWYSPAGNPLLASISRLLRHAREKEVQFYSAETAVGSNGASSAFLLHDFDHHSQGQTLFYFICKYFVNGERYSKHPYCHQIGSHVFSIEWLYCECCTSWPWLTFLRSQKIEMLISGKRWELAKDAQLWLYRHWYLLSYDIIVHVVLHDLNLQGQHF